MEIQIVSGFLGAGKTTFINQYLPSLGENLAMIENEFGSIGLDGDFINSENVKEIYAGCICCTLKSDFESGILEVYDKFKPEIILIEPSGVGRLSDIIKACNNGIKSISNGKLTKLIVIIDASTYFDFKEDFGPFFMDQIHHGNFIFFSHLSELEEDFSKILADVSSENPSALIYGGDFRDLTKEELSEILNSQEKVINPILKNTHVLRNKVFSSISKKNFSMNSIEDLKSKLESFQNEDLGIVLRAKGICTIDSKNYKFDFTKNSINIEEIDKDISSKIIIIGMNLDPRLEEIIWEKY